MKISQIVLIGIAIIIGLSLLLWKLNNFSFELIVALLSLFIAYWALWINESTKEIAQEANKTAESANTIAKDSNKLIEKQIKIDDEKYKENLDRDYIEKYWIKDEWQTNFDTINYLKEKEEIMMISSFSTLEQFILIWWEKIKYRELFMRLRQIEEYGFVYKLNTAVAYQSDKITKLWKEFINFFEKIN